MKTNRISVNDQEFLSIEVSAVNQKDSRFYMGIIPAEDFLQVFTVKPTRYNSKTEAAIAATFAGDEEYLEYRTSTKSKRAEGDEFERPEDTARVKAIAGFLVKEEYPLFPNTIIVTCYLINDALSFPIGASIEELTKENKLQLSYLKEDLENPDKALLYIPNKADSVLVIDGQHRLRGLQEANDDVRKNYEILVSFMLGFPRAVVAELFYTINYNQKPVNKSLLYDLMGEFSYELNEITFMHEIVRVLNAVERSPFYRRIKMLGVVEKDATPEIRARMTVSQAFLIDYLLNTISKDAMRSNTYPPILLYYYQDAKKHPYIVRFLLNYFQAIRRIRESDWENPTDSIICSSIGIGALIRVMHFIFLKMFFVEFARDPLKIQEVGVDDLMAKLKGAENIDFSKGKWAGVSSGGALNNLVKEIVSNIHYLDGRSYDEFIKGYKSDYVTPFKKWLSPIVQDSELAKSP